MAGKQEVGLDGTTVMVTGHVVHADQSQSALAQPRNHLVGKRLALVQFDER